MIAWEKVRVHTIIEHINNALIRRYFAWLVFRTHIFVLVVGIYVPILPDYILIAMDLLCNDWNDEEMAWVKINLASKESVWFKITFAIA